MAASFAWLVRALMALLYPVAFPLAKMLDFLLGKEHRLVYKRTGTRAGREGTVELKELVERVGETHIGLNADEVRLIRGALELTGKAVKDILTPLRDLYCLKDDQLVDKDLVDAVLSKGYSRIPVFSSADGRQVRGMLLVKWLLGTVVQQKNVRVGDVHLEEPILFPSSATLFDALTEFKKGKGRALPERRHGGVGHMAIVKENDAILGIITMEDIIEEIILDEILDETDQQFVDLRARIPVSSRVAVLSAVPPPDGSRGDASPISRNV